MVDIIDIFALLLNNNLIAGLIGGLIVAIVTALFQRNERKLQFDFDARKTAWAHYMELYARITHLQIYVISYMESMENKGSAKTFVYNELIFEERTSEQIAELHKSEYDQFIKCYLNMSNEGYELFINRELRDYLYDFWAIAEKFNNKPSALADAKEVKDFKEAADKATVYMEKLFSLKPTSIMHKLKLKLRIIYKVIKQER